MKDVSVDVSPFYASSVSELAKTFNFGKPICSSSAIKGNDCNTK